MKFKILHELSIQRLHQSGDYNLNLLNINKNNLHVRTFQLTQKIKINSIFTFTSKNDNYSSTAAATTDVINIKFYSKM